MTRTLLMLAVLLLPTASLGQTPPGDHYLCYKGSKAKGETKLEATQKQLVDQFQDQVFDVKKVVSLCNPATKIHNTVTTTPQFPAVHQQGYQIKLPKGADKFVASDHTVFDQFGSLQLTVQSPASLLVRTGKTVLGTTFAKCKLDPDCEPGLACIGSACIDPAFPLAPANDVGVDNYKCYKVATRKGTPKFAPIEGGQVQVTDQFGGPLKVEITKPTKLCTPVNKANENPGAETHPGHLMCYQAKLTKTDPAQPKFVKTRVAVANGNFDDVRLDAKSRAELCVPAFKDCEPTAEVCDGRDNDCNGQIDDGNPACNQEPQDPDEQATFNEDQINAGQSLLDFKLVGSFDADGDDLDVQSLDGGAINAVIDGQDVSADFAWELVGFVGTLKYLGNAGATFTVDPETGTETISSLDDALWDGLGAGDSVSIGVDYTVTDGSATDTSHQTISILGVTDSPAATFVPDADACAFPWSLFSFQADVADSLKVLSTLDADGLERQFLKLQINGADALYNLDFNNDGVVDPSGEPASFHGYSAVLGKPVIIDALIAEALSSGDALQDVSNIKPAMQGGGVFDPSDPINTFFFLDELSDGSQGGAGNFAPLYLIGTAGSDDPLNGNNSSDVVLGVDGNDSSLGNFCEDYVDGGAGDDALGGSAEDDVVNGGSGSDAIDGSGGADVLLGGTGADALNGSGQGDALYGGIDQDRDTLTGGTGDADLFVFAVTTNGMGGLVLTSDNDVITDFSVTADWLGFLDYSPTRILANDDTNRDLILDALSDLSGHVVITIGQFSGNASMDTKLTFDGGGALILESINDVDILDELFAAQHLQVLSGL